MTVAALDNDGLEVVGEAGDGAEAIEQYEKLRPDVIVMDVTMPRMDGPRATAEIVQRHPEARIIALTGHVESDAVTHMIVAGAIGYAVKGAAPEKLRAAVTEACSHAGHVDPAAVPGLFESVVRLAREERARRAEAERLHAELQDSYRDTVEALVAVLRHRDDETEDHAARVTRRVVSVGQRMRLSEQSLRDLEYGAIFHDIGKVAVPDSILHNTDALTTDEWAVIKQHTVVGQDIIRPVAFLRNVGVIVRHSHEHWDGTGYPDGLAGEKIPIESRIIFACDAYDAMTSDRSYQKAMSCDSARHRMMELSGTHFDPAVVEVLLRCIEDPTAQVAV